MSENNTNRRGRPVNPNSTRTLYVRVNPQTNAAIIHGRGRLPANSQWTKVVVHRSINHSNYVHGQTAIISQEDYTVPANAPEVAPVAANVVIPEPVAVAIPD